jgi:hypothetical protein
MRLYKTNFIVFGLLTGTAFACIVTLSVTTWEVIQNPGGIFRGPEGMNWGFIRDTAVSWLLPTFTDAVIVASVGHLFITGLMRISKNLRRKDRSSMDSA